jgi:hypothetical protein
MAASIRSRTPSASTRFDTAEAFALQACDDTDSLRGEVLCAYVCLEKLIAPLEVGDTEQLGPTRTELGSLVRLVNEEMSRRIDAADSATRAMRAALATPEAA